MGFGSRLQRMLALLTGAAAANQSEVCRARIEGELAKCGGAAQQYFEESQAKRQKRQEAFSKDEVKVDRTDKIVRFGEVPEGEPP